MEYSTGPPLQRLRLSNGTHIRIKGLPCPFIITFPFPPQERDPNDGSDAQFITGKGRLTVTNSIDIQGEGPGTREPLHSKVIDIHFGCERSSARHLSSSHASVSSLSTPNGLVDWPDQINFRFLNGPKKSKKMKKKSLGWCWWVRIKDQRSKEKVSTIDPGSIPKRIIIITEEIRRNISQSWLFNICRNSQDFRG